MWQCEDKNLLQGDMMGGFAEHYVINWEASLHTERFVVFGDVDNPGG